MAKSLFEYERIITTPQKAKEVRRFVEQLITLARRALPYKNAADPTARAKYLHYYRQVYDKLQDKKMVQKLFGEGEWRDKESLAQRYAERPSGQTRIVRLSGSRLGVAVGTSYGEIPVFTYEMAGRSRTLKMLGNRLGDNAEQVIFELVEKETPVTGEQEVAPTISISDDSAKATPATQAEAKGEPKDAEQDEQKKEQ
jgi:large subunit ribosomal protein L17